MSLAQLRAFLLAAQLGSFTAAARQIGIAQASVSELVRRLEEEFEVELFVRGKRELRLTAAGQELLARAEIIVRSTDEAAKMLRSMRALEAGTASFGLLKYAANYSLSDLAKQFYEAHPNVRIRLVGQNSVEVAAAVRSGALEAGLVVLPIDTTGLQVTPMIRDEVFYATAEPTRLPRAATARTLAEAPMILYDTHQGQDPTRRQLAERAENEGLRVRSIMELENAESALSLVSRGVGDSFVCGAIAQSSAMPKNVLLAPFDPPMFDTIALIQRSHTILSPATREIAAMAKRILQQHARRAASARLPAAN